ncbi:MAG: T9SS type A sorting domain-containing protein [Chitinophagales bacterium]|nr:T9SS type A sorting domain-containing protein [Chitinophagales bacterium]
MIRLYPLFFFLLVFFIDLNAQNGLYIKGQAGAISAANTTLFNNGALIFVNGEISNNQGLLVNATGTLELTGNFSNYPTADNTYQSSGTERFYGLNQQMIYGTLDGTTSLSGRQINQFNNLKVYKSLTSIPNKYLTLKTNVNVANNIDFETVSPNSTIAGTGVNQAVIRTDSTSPSNVGDYANELYVRNPSAVDAITNAAALSGNGHVRYVEGKLRRQVNAAVSYDFPVGFKPGTLDGMEGFNITFVTAPANKSILGYIQNGTDSVKYRNVVCDIGKDPGLTPNDPYSTCAGAPDGILDKYYLEPSIDLQNEWVANASDAVGIINYNITLYPGTLLDPLTDYYSIPSSCTGNGGKLLRVVTRNGVVDGNNQIGPDIFEPFELDSSYLFCNLQGSVQPIGLSTQNGFSKFRIHGTSLNANTALPVELLYLHATPVNNTYINVDWKTATEINNKGFDVERSTDAIDFKKIAFVVGNGTTTIPHSYFVDDHDVVAGIDYYYRLKIIDKDGTYSYSPTVSARLEGNKSFAISEIYPNPTMGNSSVDIIAPENGKLIIQFLNVIGQQLKEEHVDLKEGINKVNIKTTDLAAATYIVSFQYSELVMTKKLIKEN